MIVVKNAKGHKVVRNLVENMVATLILLLPASAYSLGIGDIKLHSALNQNLNAELKLLASPNEKLIGIKVKLAPRARFDKAGIPWSYFLSDIKFKSIAQADGSIIVKLSSNEALKEPFLDFILEVNRAEGSLYREFTVLVDPPVAYTQQKSQQVKNERVDDSIGSATQYGPTHAGDSLWKVATEINTYPNVSMQQLVISIYQTNPKAFYSNNINALMAGQTLDIPTKEAVLSVSKAAALAEFKRQIEVWNETAFAKVKSKQLGSEQSELRTQLELEAPTEEENSITKYNPLPGEVVAEQITSAGSSVTESSNNDLALHSRLEKLEKDLLALQKILVLKDERLAYLQDQQAIKTTPTIDNAPTAQTSNDKPKTSIVSKHTLKPEPIAKTNRAVSSNVLLIVGTIILGLLSWLWSRSKKHAEQQTEQLFATTNDDPADNSSVREDLHLSEFIPSNFEPLDANENKIDLMAEADVYLAYDRYQQAEDLIRQAIEDKPDEDKYKLKLLEILQASKNKRAFEAFATELTNAGKHNDHVFWGKVVAMGVNIAPDFALFNDQTDAKADFDEINAGSRESATNTDNEDLANFDFSLDDDTPEPKK